MAPTPPERAPFSAPIRSTATRARRTTRRVPQQWRSCATAAALRRARDLGARRVAIDVLGDRLSPRQRAHATVEGAILGTYTFDRYKREKNDKAVADLIVLSPDGRSTREVGQGARTGEVFALATWFARDLVNSPANDVHPTYLAKAATDLA